MHFIISEAVPTERGIKLGIPFAMHGKARSFTITLETDTTSNTLMTSLTSNETKVFMGYLCNMLLIGQKYGRELGINLNSTPKNVTPAASGTVTIPPETKPVNGRSHPSPGQSPAPVTTKNDWKPTC